MELSYKSFAASVTPLKEHLQKASKQYVPEFGSKVHAFFSRCVGTILHTYLHLSRR